MKTLIMKLLGLNTLVEEVAELKKFQRDLATAQEGLSAKVDEVTEKVDDIEVPDMDDYVAHCDLDDNIETYLNNNDYATRDWVTDEINDQIDTDRVVEECVEKLEDEIEEKVRDLFNNASPAPMTEQEIKDEIKKALIQSLGKVYFDLQK